MPAIGKAAKRINYDLGLNDLGNYLAEQRKKKEQVEVYKTLSDAVNQYQQRQKGIRSGIDPADTTFETGDSGITDMVLGDYLGKPERYEKAQGNFEDFQNALIPAMLNPNADQNTLGKVNVLSQLFGRQTEQMKPQQPKIGSVNPEHDIINELTGDIIRKGTAKIEKPDSRYERTATFNVGGKPIIRGLIKGTDQWEDLGEQYYQPQKSPVIKIDMPKPEKWKDFGDLITEARSRTIVDKDGKPVQLTQDEINYNWNRAKNRFLSNLLPNAKRWFEKNILTDQEVKSGGKTFKRKMTKISDREYYNKLADAVESGELTMEEAQDLDDANAYRQDLYGEKIKTFTSPKQE
jgi:hypothetical protein